MNDTPQAAAPEQQEKQVSINAQYIKDLSFENPGAPASLQATERPKIDINVDVNANGMGENLYEVELKITATANIESEEGTKTLFITELSYAGVFTLKGVAGEELEAALIIFCPNLLFPYARRIISDTTRDGGFPPLMLDPIDFAKLFAQQKQQQAAAAEAGNGEAPAS